MHKILTIALLVIVLFTSCEKNEIPEENNKSTEDVNIVVKTLIAENINSRGAVIKSTVAYNQDVMSLYLGVCWSQNIFPTIENDLAQGYITFSNSDKDIQGLANLGDSIDFTTIASGLLPNTQYFIRAFVTTSNGTVYGNQVVFSTLQNNNQEGTIRDIDGNSYKTVKIGNQEWMAENLRTSRFSNGDNIPNIAESTQWANTDSAAFCWSGNNSEEDNNTGKIYNWYAVSDSRNLCPDGWHVPKKSDWNELFEYISENGFRDREANALRGINSDDAGYFGFNAGKGSVRYGNNFLTGLEFCNSVSSWWMIDEVDTTKNNTFIELSEEKYVFGNQFYFDASFNVRCLKD